MNRINKELNEIMLKSDWLKIPYDELLENYPNLIREKELELSNNETPLKIPENLIVENIETTHKGRKIRLRTYKPKNKSNLPVLLFFHGGAFIFGTPEQYDFIFYRLSIDVNMSIVSVDYSLAPENPFPSAVDDGYFALNWIIENSTIIQADIHKILIGGSSAGGTIAMSITHLARDLGNNSIFFQYLLYPPTDDRLDTPSMNEFAIAPMQTRKSAKFMWQHYLGKKNNENPKYAIPLRQKNFKNLPPACIVVCELDPLKDEAIHYANKLRNENIPVELIEIKGAIHAFDFFPCQLSEDFYKTQITTLKNAIHLE
ncbi:alpha/beta hydrolase [Sphingobacterium sp. HJSM2_6]|uniref:alpha/beta hydrolase n=1 Tax=Sphingobacterium sp. HJSM2_6 TaxID=3366264 RepID=UPI003BC9A923